LKAGTGDQPQKPSKPSQTGSESRFICSLY
jgi:hypothetical protein